MKTKLFSIFITIALIASLFAAALSAVAQEGEDERDAPPDGAPTKIPQAPPERQMLELEPVETTITILQKEPLDLFSRTPAANALDVARSSDIEVQFNTTIDGATVDEDTFNVDGSMSGKISGNYFGGGTDTITFDPDSDFKAGETVTVTITTGIQGEGGSTLAGPVTWQFVAEAPQGYGTFEDSGQSLGNRWSLDVELGDVDGDDDLDAVVANYNQGTKVWLNDGGGTFTDSGQNLGVSQVRGVALGDIDGDGALDAFVVNWSQPNKVWLNNGSGNFTDSGQSLGDSLSYGVALGDVNGDGDLDAFVVNGGANKVWLNNGTGSFTDSGQSLGSLTSYGIALGDVDGDGDLDAFVANYDIQGNVVWLNDGSGTFTDSGQSLGNSYSYGVALGDVDGDGDLDAFVANDGSAANKVWLNGGSGNFTSSGQSLGSSSSRGIALGDVDGDGDLDAFVTNDGQGNQVWLNDGSGIFSDSGQSMGSAHSQYLALGDVDGDDDLDAFVTNYYGAANKVWLNVTSVECETAIYEGCDVDGVVVIPVTIVRVKDAATEETVPGVQIADYVASLAFTPGFMEVLDIRGGDPPFDTIPPESIVIDNEGGMASVSDDVGLDGTEPPVVIFRIVARLTDSALVSGDLTVNVVEVSDTDGGIMNAQDQPMVLTFQRGDVQKPEDGDVDITDAMFGVQWIVGLRPVDDVSLLGIASVKHDDNGDIPDIVDCMFIAQYVVGLRDEWFEVTTVP